MYFMGYHLPQNSPTARKNLQQNLISTQEFNFEKYFVYIIIEQLSPDSFYISSFTYTEQFSFIYLFIKDITMCHPNGT